MGATERFLKRPASYFCLRKQVQSNGSGYVSQWFHTGKMITQAISFKGTLSFENNLARLGDPETPRLQVHLSLSRFASEVYYINVVTNPFSSSHQN